MAKSLQLRTVLADWSLTTLSRSQASGANRAVKKIGARVKLIRYGNNVGNRLATSSEKWFPLCARKIAEAFAEALRLRKLLRKLFFQSAESRTCPTPRLNKLPSDRLWFELSKASPNPAFLNKFALSVRLGLWTDNAQD